MSSRTAPHDPATRDAPRRGWVGPTVCGTVTCLVLAATAYWLLLAYSITPDGPWDHKAVSDARITAGLGLFFACVAGLLVLAFQKAKWLRVWWYALPAVFAAGALWRLVFPGQL